jgi:hypothetical protein
VRADALDLQLTGPDGWQEYNMNNETTMQQKRRIAAIDYHAFDFQYRRNYINVTITRTIQTKKRWWFISPADSSKTAVEKRGDCR